MFLKKVMEHSSPASNTDTWYPGIFSPPQLNVTSASSNCTRPIISFITDIPRHQSNVSVLQFHCCLTFILSFRFLACFMSLLFGFIWKWQFGHTRACALEASLKMSLYWCNSYKRAVFLGSNTRATNKLKQWCHMMKPVHVCVCVCVSPWSCANTSRESSFSLCASSSYGPECSPAPWAMKTKALAKGRGRGRTLEETSACFQDKLVSEEQTPPDICGLWSVTLLEKHHSLAASVFF